MKKKEESGDAISNYKEMEINDFIEVNLKNKKFSLFFFNFFSILLKSSFFVYFIQPILISFLFPTSILLIYNYVTIQKFLPP